MSVKNNVFFDKEAEFHIPTYKRLPVIFEKGKDVYLWDSDGKKYIDFIAGLGVVNLGHCHSKVIDAFCLQAQELIHVSNLFYTKPQIKLAERLVKMSLPGGKCFFCNSGAEANEGAIKLARRYGKTHFADERVEIITALRSFHGRTLKTLAATGQPDKQLPFQPLPSGFKHVKFNDISALRQSVDNNTAAVMLEVIQGEGGVYPAEQDYLKEVRRFYDEHQLLLILDEVQTGFGRTGKIFAFQHYGIEPDIISVAKGLGNGLPIGAFIAKKSIADIFNYGDHGSTFGGGPVVCAGALATLTALTDEKLPEKAAKTGAYFKQKLNELAAADTIITDVRGNGLMLGLEIAKQTAPEIVIAMLEQGFIINNIGKNILRFLPPLTIAEKHIDSMLLALTTFLKD